MNKTTYYLTMALEALEEMAGNLGMTSEPAVITDIKEALAQPEQEPVAYDKTEMNCFVQDLYDKKMKEGKHGHYETMFHVVHQAIKRVPPQRTWVGLTDTETDAIYTGVRAVHREIDSDVFARAIEAKLKEKNT